VSPLRRTKIRRRRMSKKCEICGQKIFSIKGYKDEHKCPSKWKVKLAGDNGLETEYFYCCNPEDAAERYARVVDSGIQGFFSGGYEKPWTVEVCPAPFDGTGAKYFEITGRVQLIKYEIREVKK